MKRKSISLCIAILLIIGLICVFVACNDNDSTPQTVEFTITFDSQGGSEV